MRKGCPWGERTHPFEKEMQNTKPSIFYSFSAFEGPGTCPDPEGWEKIVSSKGGYRHRSKGLGMKKIIWIEAKLKGCMAADNCAL